MARTIDDYVARYPRLCALLITMHQGLASPSCAAMMLRDHVERRGEPSYYQNPAPEVADAVTMRHAFTGQRYRRALATLRHTPLYETTPPVAPCAYRDMNLLLTPEGFLNLDQACEFRLRYEDVTVSDCVNGIDVILSNGSSRLVREDDPGFDQLVDIIEEQGYVLSTARRG